MAKTNKNAGFRVEARYLPSPTLGGLGGLGGSLVPCRTRRHLPGLILLLLVGRDSLHRAAADGGAGVATLDVSEVLAARIAAAPAERRLPVVR